MGGGGRMPPALICTLQNKQVAVVEESYFNDRILLKNQNSPEHPVSASNIDENSEAFPI